jgi:nucleoside-diphosphate kinase
MPNHPKKERTFVILKPDTIQRSLAGEIIHRIERTGLKLVAIKMLNADEDRLTKHYGKDDQWYLEKGTKRVKLMQEAGKAVDSNRLPIEYGKDIIRGVVRYMQSSPVVAMVWEGNQAVAVVRKIVGTTDPTTSDVGTIRGDYQIDSYSLSDAEERGIRNILHCSDQPSEAEREIGIWFSPEELMAYRHINEAVLEDASLKEISA